VKSVGDMYFLQDVLVVCACSWCCYLWFKCM